MIAGIVGAYNNRNTPPYIDTDVGGAGYNRGVGISPFGRLLSLRIFIVENEITPTRCENTFAGIFTRALSYNASILNLSSTIVNNNYTGNSIAFDTYSRSGSNQNNRPLLFAVSAGNRGLAGIGVPGNAKNVLTVGATMSTRQSTVQDSCGQFGSSNADDVPVFSSRGKTADGRAKPDLVAPGIHIQGPATQSPIFSNPEVCGALPLKRYYPAGQINYTWATGTSFAAPAVVGASQLLYEYYKRVGFASQDPSPALAKALLINSAHYLGLGNAGNDNLPSESQGWGAVNIGALFSYTPANTFVVDQTVVFSSDDENRLPLQLRGELAKPGQPLKISLVWTDAPGIQDCGTVTNSDPCLQNNLDLEVEMIDEATYRGNVFNKNFSNPNVGSFDRVNNVENIYIQNPTNNGFIVKITSASLLGDGVPGNASQLDQDFALVIHNARNVTTVQQPSTALSSGAPEVADNPGGNANGIAEPNELVTLRVPLTNTGSQTAYSVSSLLSLAPVQGAATNAVQTGVTLVTTRADYFDIAPNTTQPNNTPFSLRLDPTYKCGQPVSLVQQTSFNGNLQATSSFTIPVGSLGPGNPTNYPSSLGVTIPETTTVFANLNIPPSTPGKVSKIKATLSIDHQDNSNLYVSLIAPNGGKVWLFNTATGSNNFDNVTFDDNATSIIPFTPPVGGYSNKTYRPNVPFADGLSAGGEMPSVAGLWKLEIQDASPSTTGTGRLKSWLLTIEADSVPVCKSSTVKPPAFVTARRGAEQSGAIGTTFNPLQVEVVDAGNVPLHNIAVTFQAPLSGASGSFANGSKTLVALTDEDGRASANGFTANTATGVYTITARVSGVSNPAYFGLTNVAGEVVSLSSVAGNGQGTLVNSPFGTSLRVRVLDSASNPISGQGITFIPPDTRTGGIAGGSFSGASDVEGSGWTVLSNGQGYATAPVFTANGVTGSYSVIASSGLLTASFSLVNLAGCPNGVDPYFVTSSSDDGSGVACGTLSRALLQASSGTVISFGLGGGSVINISGSLPPLRGGVTLDGESCVNLLTLNGSGVNGVGLRVEGGATLKNLRLVGFGQTRLVVGNAGTGSSKLSCVKAT